MQHQRIALGAIVFAAALAHPARAESTCDQYASFAVMGGAYTVQNNFWNPQGGGTQCLDVNTSSGAFTITGTNSVATNGAPGGYPSIYKGCHWGACTTNSGLPIQLSSLSNAPTTWSTTSPGGGNWDVAYDIWFNQASTTTGQPDGAEIMIWINRAGVVGPAGSKTGNTTINGINFDVWTAPKGTAGFNGTWNIVSYVATSTRTSVNFDLKPFFTDSVARGMVNNAWYLIDVEAGFEGWQSWSGLRSNAFTVDFNTAPCTSCGGAIDPAAWYSVVNQNSGACVDDAEWGTTNGSIVQQYSCNANGQLNQEWQFQPTDSGYYKVVSRQAPLALDAGGSAQGAKLQLWSYGGGANQQWMPVALGNGYYKLIGRQSGRCVDVPSASTADGVQLQIWDCNNSAAQAFQLIAR